MRQTDLNRHRGTVALLLYGLLPNQSYKVILINKITTPQAYGGLKDTARQCQPDFEHHSLSITCNIIKFSHIAIYGLTLHLVTDTIFFTRAACNLQLKVLRVIMLEIIKLQ